MYEKTEQPSERRCLLPGYGARAFTGVLGLCLGMLFLCGCGTTTQRTATEQLLLSEAVDRSVNQIDFSPLAGRKVFLDTRSLRPAQQGPQLIGGEYVASALKQKMLAARCLVEETQETADLVVEARIGALATNGHDVVYGLPASNGLSAISSAIAAGPALPPIPELSVGRMNVLAGMSKIAVFAYDRETREPVWQSGNARFESTARSSWVFGAGPFVRCNIYDSMRFADSRLHQKKQNNSPTGERIPLDIQMVFDPEPPRIVEPEAAGPQPEAVSASLTDATPEAGAGNPPAAGTTIAASDAPPAASVAEASKDAPAQKEPAKEVVR